MTKKVNLGQENRKMNKQINKKQADNETYKLVIVNYIVMIVKE